MRSEGDNSVRPEQFTISLGGPMRLLGLRGQAAPDYTTTRVREPDLAGASGGVHACLRGL